jgi:dCMP deaminase
MIIGITGTLGAGKGTIVEFLKEKGFKHYSVREFLIKEIKKRNLIINRRNMVSVANEIRKNNYPSYIIDQLFEKAKQETNNIIIESIRTPNEAEKIKEKGGILIAVDADSKIRYSRILIRQSETDNINFEEFLENEKDEMFSINPYEQNLSKCISLSDFKLDNNKDIKYLKNQLEEVLKKIELKKLTSKKEASNINEEIDFKKENKKRPSWDEYFMNITHVISERATCDRGKSAAIAVKDKKIIATGYVGAPKGLPHCDEIGHLLSKFIDEDGSISQHCIRTVHAEQNVICQAARYGISLEGSTMYMKMTPCFTCAKMIINTGIKRIVAEKRYQKDKHSLDFLKQAGIKVDILNQEIEEYSNQELVPSTSKISFSSTGY